MISASSASAARLLPLKRRQSGPPEAWTPLRLPRAALALLGIVALGGCSLTPRGTDAEREHLRRIGASYEAPIERRSLPELAAEPSWRDVLQRAFLANGEVEGAYFEWKAAVSRIDVASAYPNTNVALGFNYLFSGDNMKAWDRTTVNVGFDPMQMLSLPVKVRQAGRVALDEARAAGEQFRAAKFGLQRRVLTAYVEYALLAEKIRIQRENVGLLELVYETASARVRAGAQQQELLRAEIELRLAENALRDLEAQIPQARARLNAMMAREADAPLVPPSALPAPRNLRAADAELIALGVLENPELAALAHQTAGREDALELARLRYLPDIAPSLGFTGTVSQFVGAMISIPATIPAIRASVEEARAMLRQTQALARQTRFDTAAGFVAVLYALRNSERQIGLFERVIQPAAERVFGNTRQAYSTGSASFLDLIESQRTLLDVRLMLAEARAARETALAELEEFAGVDIETLGRHTGDRAEASTVSGAEGYRNE